MLTPDWQQQLGNQLLFAAVLATLGGLWWLLRRAYNGEAIAGWKLPRRLCFWRKGKPPNAPVRITIEIEKEWPKVVDGIIRLRELHQDGIRLMQEAVTADLNDYRSRADQWVQDVFTTLEPVGSDWDMRMLNSDVGLVRPTIPTAIPEANRISYYNVWIRVYRLQEILPRMEQEVDSAPGFTWIR